MYKLVAMDLDGTLLNTDKEISERNKRAIHRVREKGVKVVVCSGRVYAGARLYARQLESLDPIIACNGAFISEGINGKAVYSNYLSKKDCLEIIEKLRRHDIYYHLYAGDLMLTERMGFMSLRYFERNKKLPAEDRVEIEVVKNMYDRIKNGTDNVFKFVMVSDDAEQLKTVRSEMIQVAGVDVMSSNFDNIEIVNKGVSKGMALQKISEYFDIPADEMVAIGDNENDISMFEYAGLSIAMDNGEDCAKQAAKYTTASNNEDGVAQALEKFILNDK